MSKPLVVFPAFLAMALVVACGDGPSCPSGRVKVGSRCEVPEDDGDPPTVEDAGILVDSSSPSDRHPGALDAGPHPVDTCLLDQDGDHFAVEGSGAQCLEYAAPEGTPVADCDDANASANPEAIELCGDDVDSDCDGNSDEGVSETCNGEDDDCDGEVENGFACASGATGVACTTACGTQGTGACGTSCGLPEGTACNPPAETCNWKDDDCDGIVDPGLIVKHQEQVYPSQAKGAKSTVLLPKPDGAWLVDLDVKTSTDSWLRFRKVDAEGGLSRDTPMDQAPGTTSFRAATDGEWIVLLVHHKSTNGTVRSLRLDLLRSSDLSLVAREEILSQLDPKAGSQSDELGCDLLWASDVAMFKDAQGAIQVAAVYGYVDGIPGADGFCEAKVGGGSKLQRFTYANGFWSHAAPISLYPVPEHQVNFGQGSFESVERMPCRDEWLVNHGVGLQDQKVRRLTLDGMEIETVLSYAASSATTSMHVGEVNCTKSGSSLMLGRSPLEAVKSTELRLLHVEHATGKVMPIENPVIVPAFLSNAVEAGSRWFTTTFPFDGGPFKLTEMSRARWGSSRDISLFMPGSSGANPGGYHPVFRVTGYEPLGVLANRGVLMVSAINSTTSDSNLNTFTADASGVLYTVDCP